MLSQSVRYRSRDTYRPYCDFGKSSARHDEIERLAPDYPREISWKRQNPSVNDFSPVEREFVSGISEVEEIRSGKSFSEWRGVTRWLLEIVRKIFFGNLKHLICCNYLFTGIKFVRTHRDVAKINWAKLKQTEGKKDWKWKEPSRLRNIDVQYLKKLLELEQTAA